MCIRDRKGYCTTHLGFGDEDNCHGYLVGDENKGLHYMFLMMNGARIAVGRTASAIASGAYYASLEYAKERPQGRKLSSDGKKDLNEKQSLIIEHPDVRRMLMLQKAMVEGSMNLIFLPLKVLHLHHYLRSFFYQASPAIESLLFPHILNKSLCLDNIVEE